jgi:peptidoglycan/xylan/chitin deacetylase (PgdA/CDA1 family)
MPRRCPKGRLSPAPLAVLVLCGTLRLAEAATPSQQVAAFDHAATDKKIVALTFDADMTPGMARELKSRRVASWYNEKVIETLKAERVPATLFMTGLWIESYSDVTRELAANPLFELANHSYSHGAFHSPCYNLFPVRDINQAAEVQKTDALLQKYGGAYKKYFRFPGLCFDADAIKRVESLGYTVIGGDVDGGDAFEKNPKWVVSDVLAHVRPGSIVVLHMHGGPNAPATGAALPEIIAGLRAQGYDFVKVSDLLEYPAAAPVKTPVMARLPASPRPNATAAAFPFLHFFRQ